MSSKPKPLRRPLKGTGHPEFNAEQLRQGNFRRAMRQSVVSGRLILPAVPALAEQYLSLCATIFKAAGRPFEGAELEHARSVLVDQLDKAFSGSSRSNIVINYEAPRGRPLNYNVAPHVSSVQREYEEWVATREPPLFGKEPDARVLTLASESGEAAKVRVLDIGAGTGRNALPLARRGHPVDAVEMTAALATELRAAAAAEKLGLRVIEKALSEAEPELAPEYDLIFLSEVVSDFRSEAQLRALTELASRHLPSGGQLLFNIHLPAPGYTPDRTARELSQQLYSTIFTRSELANALEGTGLTLASDVSVHDYEAQHLPKGAFPQTGWYVEWVKGQDVFDVPNPPIEMRWVTCLKA